MEEVLDSLPENSIDSIVTDPPYHLSSIVKHFGKEDSAECQEGTDGSFKRLSSGFMGMKWDGGDIAFRKETWGKCMRVLKPGGYLLAFGGSRTYHRMTCAIEDAGFEIRDCLMWIYSSGFPKSHNIGKALDAKLKYGKSNPITMKKAEQEHGGESYELKGKNNGIMGETKIFNRKQYITETGWEGWGTALKPAYEPIVMARKPFNGSVVDNIIKYGTGGINIDECRIPFELTLDPATNPLYRQQNGYKQIQGGEQSEGVINWTSGKNKTKEEGRFPSNLMHDGSPEAVKTMQYGEIDASRCFYSPKASKQDRDEGLELDFENKQTTDGCIRSNAETARKYQANSSFRKNIHPTVKPTNLMRYLIRMATHRGGTILDPFMGSGSTGKATMLEKRGYKFIGVEMTEKYLPIAKARIDYAINSYDYELKKAEKETGQLNLFEGGD